MANIKKETVMVLKVDLECASCYKKVKKVLCKFPQIRDQVYNEKNNTVNITVVCCSPEKIRDKLCSKGGKTIKSIEILAPLPPPNPKEPEPKKPKEPLPADKPKPQPEKPKEPPPADKPKPQPEKPPEKPKVSVVAPPEKPKDAPKPQTTPPEKPKDPPKKPDPAPTPAPPPPKAPELGPVPAPAPVVLAPMVEPYPQPYPIPVGFCCPQCLNHPFTGGPCYHGYGRAVAPPLGYYDLNKYGYGYEYGYGGPPKYGSRCDYFSEENTSGCRIM